MMKRMLVLILISLYFINGSAQSIDKTNGTFVPKIDFSDVKGSPYLFDEWKKGNVTLANNTVYKDLDLKYDLLNDKLYFKSKTQGLLAFANPVKEFSISGEPDSSQHRVFRNGYLNIPGVTANNYLEVLVDGKTQLLRRLTKHIREENVYPYTSTNKYFIDTKFYYLYLSNKGFLVKKDKKSMLSVLEDKKSELENFIKENSLDLKEENSLKMLITYYNTLFSK